MKKLIASLVVFGVLLTSSPAHALSLSDLQKEVENLKQEISSLRSMMSGAVLGVVTPTTTYSLGMRSSEIVKYQQALIDQKYLATGNATGVFGPLTYSAVKNFQTAKGLKADGVLGSQTQALLLGGQTEVSMTGTCRDRIKVLSPNGGEFYQAGSQVTINWSTCDVPLNAQIKIELEAWGNFPAYSFGSTINDGTEVFTLPTVTTLPGMQYGLGYKVAATYIPKTIMFGEPSFYRDFSDNLFTINAMCVANTWTKKADFGGKARKGAISFSINGKGYLGTGYDGYIPADYKDFWEYDPVTNKWTQKADFGGGYLEDAAAFSISGKGYVGTGSPQGENSTKKFWEYNPSTNTWSQKTDFAGIKRTNAVGFSIGSKGYIGTGSGSGVFLKDFWEYDPSTDKWTQKADFGGEGRWLAEGFSVDSKGYLGTGASADNKKYKDFWEYDPVTNKWTQKADFGGGERFHASSFSIGTKGYMGNGAGGANNDYIQDFWQYDPALNTWVQKTSTNYVSGINASFAVGNKGYFGVQHYYSRTVEEYCPD